MPDDWSRGLKSSALELREFAELMERRNLSPAQQVAFILNDLSTTVRAAAVHNCPVSPAMIRQIDELIVLVAELI